MLSVGKFHLDTGAVAHDVDNASLVPLRMKRAVQPGRNCLAIECPVSRAFGESGKKLSNPGYYVRNL